MNSPPVEVEVWEQTNSEQLWLALILLSAVREETQQSTLVRSRHKNECEPWYSHEPKHYMSMSPNNNNQESEM